MHSVKLMLAGLIGFLLSLTDNADAAITLPTDFDVAGVETIAGLMIAALAIIWVAHKVKAFVGR